MEKVNAKLRFLKMTPRKVRLVADLVRGKQVEEARQMLKVLNKRAGRPILKLIESAVANAKHNFSLVEDGLKIETITVDDGPTTKRWMSKAMGRATTVRQRSSHVKIVLAGEVDAKAKKESETKIKKIKTVKGDINDVKKEKFVPDQETKKTDIKQINTKAVGVSQGISKPRKVGTRNK